jgi:nicotinate-nucleotide--dimethylbenzimidazole phosphoribosyltransferase
VTGDGANRDDRRRGRKIEAVTAALQRPGHGRSPLRLLASLGGLEHAALVGTMLAAASRRVPVILDGVTVNAAALVATSLSPPVAGYLIAGHRSTEPGSTAALAQLGLPPLIDLQLRLGEGTGAVLAIPIVAAAANVLRNMAFISDVS